MKSIIEFINEKQNFLIKGHTKSQYDELEEIYKVLDNFISKEYQIKLNYKEPINGSPYKLLIDYDNVYQHTYEAEINGSIDVASAAEKIKKILNAYKNITRIKINDTSINVRYKIDDKKLKDMSIFSIYNDSIVKYTYESKK